MTDLVHTSLQEYLDAIEAGQRRDAIDAVVHLLDDGIPAERIIVDVLAAAQAEIGRGWMAGRWSVAMEHRASGITESALSAIAELAMATPGAPAEGSAGRTIVACSEGEWHALPGRMASEVLRLRGVDVTFIGPSVPAGELAAMVGVDPPAVVAVTCSMPLSLAGSWRTVSALREMGTRVICGGRGFGSDGTWGLAIGADEWAADFSSGADLIVASMSEAPIGQRPPVGSSALADEQRILRRDHAEFVEQAQQRALARWPELIHVDAAVTATREDLGHTLRAIAAATVVGDPALLVDFTGWFHELLAARHLPTEYAPAAIELLLDVLPESLELTRTVATAGLAGYRTAYPH